MFILFLVRFRLLSGNLLGFKMGQGQLRVIIYINFVELDYILLHAKVHDHKTISSVGEEFDFFSLQKMSMAAILII